MVFVPAGGMLLFKFAHGTRAKMPVGHRELAAYMRSSSGSVDRTSRN